MWIPRTVEELERSVEAGDLQESATLDFKAGPAVKSKDLAKDIAAFANYGGVIIFGIAEDEMERPTRRTPFALGGQTERIANIAQTGLAPPVQLDFIELQRDANDGYLVVIVPLSPRAPHQVKIDGDNRYYGRLGKVNIRLEEGEIAALHQRRQRWELESANVFERLLGLAPADADSSKSALYLTVRPLGSGPILDRASGQDQVPKMFERIINSEEASRLFRDSDFRNRTARSLPNGWTFANKWNNHFRGPGSLVLRMSREGTFELFYNDISHTKDDGENLILHWLTVRATLQFLWIAQAVYRKASFWGEVDLGIVLTGLMDCRLGANNDRILGQPFGVERMSKMLRIPTARLDSDSTELIRELFGDFYYGLQVDPESLFPVSF